MAEILVPYPRPNYKDPDLISKELVNGTFAQVLRDDIANFRPPGDRYAMSADELIARSLAHEKTQPQYLSEDIEDYGPGGIKEMAWLPLYASAGECAPKVVYNPKRYYNDFEYVDRTYRLPMGFIKDFYARIPHYDPNDPGLWGGYKRIDDNGNVTECKRGFVSLKTGEIRFLVDVPKKLCDGRLWINAHIYIKNGLVFVAITNSGKQIMSLDMSGHFHEFGEMVKNIVSLGDFGYIAVTTNDGMTKVLNEKLEIVQELDGDYLTMSTPGIATAQKKYPFGSAVDGVIYYAKDDRSSYKWWKTKHGVGVKIIKAPIWKYNVAVKYDFATNEFTAREFKHINVLNYNNRRGCFQPKLHLPNHNKDDKVYFHGWDGFGDFVTVQKPDGECRVYHTYDFKKWELVFDNKCNLFSLTERLWFSQPIIGGIVGFTPHYNFGIYAHSSGGENYMALHLTGMVYYYR